MIADLFADLYKADEIGRYPIFVLNYDPSRLPPAMKFLEAKVEMMAFEALSRVQRALENQSQLEAQHKRLLTSMDSKNVGVEMIRAALTRNREFLLSCLEAFPRTMTPTATSAAKAAKVFGIPELFEMILSYLCVDDILAVTQINRRSSDIFKNLSALQRRTMQLVPTKGHFFHPWPRIPDGDRTQFTMPGMRIFIDRNVPEYTRRASFNKIPLRFIMDPYEKLPKIGSVGKKMQLVYPPVYWMLVNRTCCSATNDDRYDDAEWGGMVHRAAHPDYVSDEEENDNVSFHSDNASQSDAGSAQAEEDQSELGQSSNQAGGGDDEHDVDEPTAFSDPTLEADEDDFTISAGDNSPMRIHCSTGLTIEHLLKAVQFVRETPKLSLRPGGAARQRRNCRSRSTLLRVGAAEERRPIPCRTRSQGNEAADGPNERRRVLDT